jgi:DNA-binding transcriptional ArsR family regulator
MAEESGHTGRAQRNFTIVPNGALAADINPTALKVYIALRSYLRPDYPCFPHVSTVCERFNIPERSFTAALKELQDAGLLRVKKVTYSGGFRRANEYFFPDVDDPADVILPIGLANIATPDPADIATPESTLFAGPEEEEKVQEEKVKKTGRANARTTTLPASFAIDEQMVAWANTVIHGVDLNRITEAFKNHHLAKGSKFVDWRRAWQNWVLNEVKFAAQRSTAPTTAQPRIYSAPIVPPDDPRWDD